MTMLPVSALISATPASDYESQILALCAQVGLPTTAWQSGAPELAIIWACAQVLAEQDTIVTTIAQSGFLDWAASVTPEGGPGALDALCHSLYSVDRIGATQASGLLTIVNGSATSQTWNIGELQVATLDGRRYTNTAGYGAPAGVTGTCSIAAVTAGTAGNTSNGTITVPLNPISGVSVSNPQGLTNGTDAETNAALVTRTRANLGARSPGGTSYAYDYVARSIPFTDAVLGYLSSGSVQTFAPPVNRTIAAVSSGAVTITVASAAGAIPGTVGNPGDPLDLVDKYLKAYATPLGITETTQSAGVNYIYLTIKVWGSLLPAQWSTYQAAATQALTAFFNSMAIGGAIAPNHTDSPAVFRDSLVALCWMVGATAGFSSLVTNIDVDITGTGTPTANGNLKIGARIVPVLYGTGNPIYYLNPSGV